MKRFILLGAALLLGACTAIPVKTLYKLATTDPMQVDPAVLRAAVRMPEWIAPRPGGVRLELTMQADGEAAVTEKFVLADVPVALEGKSLGAEERSGFQLYAYRLPAEDVARFRAFRETLKKRKAASNKKVGGAISVGVDACRTTTLPAGKIPVTTYLKLEAGEDYLPLLVDYDLSKPVEGQDLAARIPPC